MTSKPNFFTLLLTLVLVLALGLSGCSAAVQLPSNYAPPLLSQVYYVFPGTVRLVIDACRAAILPSNQILTDGTHYVFIMAQYAQNTAVVVGTTLEGKVVDIAEAVKNGGNLVNSKTVKEIVDSLIARGFTKVDPGTLTFLGAVMSAVEQMPMLIISPAALGDESADEWFENTFLPQEEGL